ncbi:putative T7SS-secreted protein [Streptomyces sp. 8N114]|uniref:putative T7SS-secreted protein n=1 Tax=Streptomyces sp. 8N114 TaxID=3457419 RepID=UPI003FD4F78A
MGWRDFVPDSVEEKGEELVEGAGDAVEGAGNWSADRLDDVGWESGGDWVRDKSRSAANAMGAETAEFQLDETEDPEKLIFGSPAKIRSTAKHLKDFQTEFDNVAKGLKGLHKGTLKGKAADAFWEKVGMEPAKWIKAADACEKAAGALEDFAHTVERAQSQAREAVAKYKEDKKDEAEEQLSRARSQRNTAAGIAQTAVKAARDAAPPKPDYWEQAGDGLQGLQLDATHLSGGVVKGLAGLNNFVRGINPLDPYNVTHPAEYVTNLNSTVTGIARVANDPVGTGKQMWDTFKKDPSEGVGRLIPELLGTKGIGMATKAGRAGKLAKEAADARRVLGETGPSQAARRGDEILSGRTDPVDLATGRMYLPQTDLSLPGCLPLTFTRRVDSGYRLGHWFGPSWSSTVDQRLEIDAEGVIFVAEDGRLLSYPHPAPGVPTLPSAGSSRTPLERTPDGGYTLTEPDTGRVRHFAPPQSGASEDGTAQLEQITDRNGHSITFEYDEHTGAPTRLVHSGGYVVKLTVEDNRITALTLAGAHGTHTDQTVMRYAYTNGNLTDVTNSSGLPLRFEYDDENRVISWTDTNDSRYDYVYDDQDRVIAEGGVGGHFQIRLSYDDIDQATGHKVTTLTTANGHVTRHLVNDSARIVAITDPLGHTTRTEYDDNLQITAIVDPLGRTTRYAYDEQGRCIAVTRPDGRQTRAEYNELGLPVEFVAADGARRRQEFDDRGLRTTATDPAGRTTSYSYDAAGHLASKTDALGNTTTVRCNAAGLPVEITDPLGGVTRYERDPFGRVVATTDPSGATTRLEWTAEGKLARRIAPNGAATSWTYDGEGNCLTQADATGAVTRYEYTHFDLIAARIEPDGTRYEFEHDRELRLTQVTGPTGLTWDYTYDAAGRLVAESDFDGREVAYRLDAAGQLAERMTPLGEVIAFERDELGRVTAKDAAGQITRFDYDPAGRLLSATGPDAELIYQRDKLGRIKAEMVNGRVTTFTYDALGRRTRRVTPTGAVTTYGYDAAGNRSDLTTGGHHLTFTRDKAGRETSRHIGDTLEISAERDASGRLSAQTLTAGPEARLLQQRRYHYREDGYLTGLDDHLNGAYRFDLDPVGRVTQVSAHGWSESYAYDELGNQASAHWPQPFPPELEGERGYSGTRIQRAGAVRYEHDQAGRLVVRRHKRLSKRPDTWHFAHDAEDHLTEVTTPDGTRWRYRYDPLGRRIAKERMTSDGETPAERVEFTWDGPLLIEQTATGDAMPQPVVTTWDHDGLSPLSQTERLLDSATQTEIDARFYAIVTDLVGTPRELVTPEGEIAWRTRNTLWGHTATHRSSIASTPLRFPGQYHDPETGLHYNLHRYYDPATARYTTSDPLGLTPAPNPDTYVDNPHIWADPYGLAPDYPSGRVANSASDITADPGVNYIYRGVSTEHPGYADALNGTAHPRGGPADIVEHHRGNTRSEYTSWDTNPETAMRYARGAAEGRSDLGGVVLQHSLPLGQPLHPTWLYLDDVFEVSEHLVGGSTSGATVWHVPPK